MHQQNSLAADQYISQLLDIWTVLKREAYFRFVKFPSPPSVADRFGLAKTGTDTRAFG